MRLERTSHALLGLGRVALRRDDPEAALAWLRQAHELDATHAEVTVTLARTLDELGRRDEARRFELRVPTRHPRRFFRDPVMLRALAETVSYLGLIEQADRAVAAGYPQDAVAFLDRVIRAEATNADARVRKGRVLAGMRRYDDAIAEYRRALALAPTFGLARGLEGACLAAIGRAEEAERALREGVEIDPANTETRHLLADFLAGRGETTEAIEILVQILREAPDQVPSRLLLARLLLRTGDRAGAREHVDAALREAPFDRSAIALAGRIGR